MTSTAVQRRRLGSAVLAVCLAGAPLAFLSPAAASACTVQSECVKVGTAYRKIDGVNTWRNADQLIKYDRSNGQTTSPANQWGYEVAVVDGKVTAVSDFKVGMTIPVGGYVLSGHGSEYTWLKTNAKIGTTVVLPGDTTSPPPDEPPPPPPPPSAGWLGQYWDNATLSGTPVLTRTDAEIDFVWDGAQGAGPGLDVSNDSARWTRTTTFEAGSYTFSVTGDDGVRVKVDGVTIIDGWKAQGPTTYTATRTMTAGDHTVVVEHFEQWGSAMAKFTLTKVGDTAPSPTLEPAPTSEPPPPPPPPPPTAGWSGQYWNNATLSGTPVLTRTDAEIDFAWGPTEGAGAGLDGSNDSARWTRTMSFDAASYTFSVTGDDGVRVKVDGVTIIDGWKSQGPTTYTATRPMTAGDHTVVVEHFEEWGSAVAKFSLTKATTTTPPPSGEATTGRWTVTQNPMPLRAMHATLLRDGRVLLIAGSGNDYNRFVAGSFKAAVWNPNTGGFVNIDVPEDMFCSGHVTLPDGKVLIQGGTISYAGAPEGEAYRGLRSSYVFDPATNVFTRTPNDTIEGHWYPTLTKIENGDVWAAGGYTHKIGGGGSTSIEMFDFETTRWGTAAEVPQINRYLGTYPHMFLLADGRMFYTGGHTFGDPQPGSGSFLYDWRAKTMGDVQGLRDVGLRDQAGSVLLPPAQNQTFMIAGGGSTDYGGATRSVDLIDMKTQTPSWRSGPSLPGTQGRMYLNLTTLPDRTVLASNGATGNRTGDVKAAAIYNPATNAWTEVAADPIGRNYHSAAVLLTDGRVAVFGSNPADNSYELRISVYEPPYLFRGTRPTVTAPGDVGYGQTIQLGVTGNVVAASLSAPVSSTHQTDTNARLVDLPIVGTGTSRSATVPGNPALLPPGPYMLTVVDDKGAVSTAKWVNVR